MTAISFAPTTVTPTVAPDYAASSDGQHMTAAGAFRVTTVSPGWSSSAPTTGADSDALDGNLTHLDEPYPVMVMATGNSTTTTRTISLRAGQQVIGVASVSRQLPPGPPMRGFYRIHGAAVRDGELRARWRVRGDRAVHPVCRRSRGPRAVVPCLRRHAPGLASV